MDASVYGVDLVLIFVSGGKELDVVYRDAVVDVELSFLESCFRFGNSGVCKRRLFSGFHAYIILGRNRTAGN